MKVGFVNIFGRPNAGKSTLLNALLGEKLAIVSSKVQTTRHRIKGILTEKDYQVIFSDTPGIIEPKYKLHVGLNNLQWLTGILPKGYLLFQLWGNGQLETRQFIH